MTETRKSVFQKTRAHCILVPFQQLISTPIAFLTTVKQLDKTLFSYDIIYKRGGGEVRCVYVEEQMSVLFSEYHFLFQ